MIAPEKDLARTVEISSKVGFMLQRRLALAQEHVVERLHEAVKELTGNWVGDVPLPWEPFTAACDYLWDCAQRSVLFWDTMRQRGNQFLEHERAGKPPVLFFDYEMVLDARKFDRPVNYALLRILPPKGVTVDPKRRPYVILDPRAGHGPGIGGFKDDSQVGVALRAGHPVYFIIFFPDPEPGQSLTDVTAAEQQFVRKVRQLHPQSPKPVIVGNCQGGWAAMMLAASDPEETGPIVINGAPMSYWGGAWREGEGDNPMRYAGGLLGGTWLASLAADLGHGVFDGAWLVQNMENLNLANTFWDKYYHVFANVDTEPPRFLEFERWWGGFYLMNREEIEWITRNLFVGNKLWSGAVRGHHGDALDLREIKSPIVLFASLGDNITPPQQAFNWIADVYGSTDEIKARGQVIVGLLHKDVGHLGIFVSGRVAKKEHTQIVSVLKSIEALPPGLYGMHILDAKGGDGRPTFEVQFVEHRLEEITKRLNRFARADEQPFRAVEKISEFNQQAYELFAQPWMQALSNDFMAKFSRVLHPLRVQRWMFSDLNPWLTWIGPAAEGVKRARRPVDANTPTRQAERFFSELLSSTLEFQREIRDAISEALFFQTYGNLFGVYIAEEGESAAPPESEAADPREVPYIKEALESISRGGYPAAVARVFALLTSHGKPVSLSELHLKRELLEKYASLFPEGPRDELRRIRGEQEIIVRYDRERAFATLPHLVEKSLDRKRLRKLMDCVLTKEHLAPLHPDPEQLQMLERIRALVSAAPRSEPLFRRGIAPGFHLGTEHNGRGRRSAPAH